MNAAHSQRDRAGLRILIAGTGGQGVLTAARLLCDCFVAGGHDVVSAQLHGMAQRGGAVQSSVIIDGGICPVLGTGRADLVVGFEPVETARAIPFMSKQTAVMMNTTPVTPFVLAQQSIAEEGDGHYPDIDELTEYIRAAAAQVITLDATSRATDAGSSKAMNVVMLGALFASDLMPCSAEVFLEGAVNRMPERLRAVNTKAFRSGLQAVRGQTVGGPSS